MYTARNPLRIVKALRVEFEVSGIQNAPSAASAMHEPLARDWSLKHGA